NQSGSSPGGHQFDDTWAVNIALSRQGASEGFQPGQGTESALHNGHIPALFAEMDNAEMGFLPASGCSAGSCGRLAPRVESGERNEGQGSEYHECHLPSRHPVWFSAETRRIESDQVCSAECRERCCSYHLYEGTNLENYWVSARAGTHDGVPRCLYRLTDKRAAWSKVERHRLRKIG